MIDNIVIFTGSKRDFHALLDSRISECEETITFLDLIQLYNARIRPGESGVKENALMQKKVVDNCIVRTEDYSSVLEHVLSNFINVLIAHHEIGTLYVQNPPKRVLNSLRSMYSDDEIEYLRSEYVQIDRDMLKTIYRNLNDDIIGQDECKRQLLSGLYRLSLEETERPAVLMLYGPSGVGKTETAKSISHSLGGELLRIQFSMMQTSEAYNYVFGAEHSKPSFARDMVTRETNVILIDEFDKVNPLFYNAFYELFDEGRYVDTNYDVDLHGSIFLCTSNFMSEDEIKKALGPAMFSRIGCCIEYADLTVEQKISIIQGWYDTIISQLKEDEKTVIEGTDILAWFMSNAERYDNIRILKVKLENAVFDTLTDTFILADSEN